MDVTCYVTTPFMENCYVLKDGGETMVIDPGEATPELLSAIEGENVTILLNTHAHIDHVGGNAEIKAKTGAEFVCHPDCVELLRNVSMQGQMFGLSVPDSPEPDRFIQEGDTVKLGASAFQVVEVPGHAPGHIALIGDGFVIGGDVLFQGSIGRTDLPGGDHAQLMQSIREKLMPLPDETVVYSGHGPPTTIGQERVTNPFIVAMG